MQKTVQQFLQKLAFLSWKQKAAIFVVVVLFAVFIPSQFAHAGDFDVVKDLLSADPMNAFITMLAILLSVISAAIGKMITLTISVIVIPILGYNNFGDSNIISIGWPLVRDIVNMFVIVILLVIAIKTMLGFGGNKIAWEQQLPRLFLAIVAVNFSRMLSVLMIDAGQVIMMTFVNALRDIAAGNFVALFQLDSFMGVSNDVLKYASGGESGADSFGYLGSSYLILVLLILVLAVLWILAIVFIYRIVILWVLVILSPIAFFLGGIKDVFGEAGGKYGDWWKQFVGAVTLGPIMTFFLWLGLAAASQGSIAASEGFDLGVQADSTYGLLNEIFQVEKILSLFIGYVIIIAGFKAASSASSALGGIAGSLINEQSGMSLAKGIAAAPARVGGYAARETGKAVERRTGIARDMGREISSAGTALERSLGGGMIGSALGGAVRYGGGSLEGVGVGVVKKDREDAKKSLEDASDGELASFALKFEGIENPQDLQRLIGGMTYGEGVRAQEFVNTVSLDSAGRRRITAKAGRGGGEQATNALGNLREMGEQNAIAQINAGSINTMTGDDEKFIEGARQLEVSRMHELRNPDGTVNTARQRELMTDEGFRINQLSNDALMDSGVRGVATSITRTDVDQDGVERQTSLLSRANAGQEGLNHAQRESLRAPARTGGDEVDINEAGVEDIANTLRHTPGRANDITGADIQGTNGNNIVQGMIESGLNLRGLDEEVRNAFMAGVEEFLGDDVTPQVRERARASAFTASGDPTHIGLNQDGEIAEGFGSSFNHAVASDPTILGMPEIQQNIAVNNYDNPAAQSVANSTTPGMLGRLQNMFQHSDSDDVRAGIRDSMNALENSLRAEFRRAVNDGDNDRRDRFRDLANTANSNWRDMN